MKLDGVLQQLRAGETALAGRYRETGARHADDQDVFHLCHTLAAQCDAHAARLAPLIRAEGERQAPDAPSPAPTGAPLLDDLSGLYLAAEGVAILWVMAGQAARAKRDPDLLDLVTGCNTETDVQVKALLTHIKTAAPQVLTVE